MSMMTPYPLNLEDDLDSLKDYECQRNVAAVTVADYAAKLFCVKTHINQNQKALDETMDKLQEATKEYMRKRNAFDEALDEAFCDGEPVAVSKTETTTPPTCSETEQVADAPALPKWCKVGQWVIERDGKLWVIKGIQGSIVTVQTYPGAPCSMSSIPAEGDLRPVRFREYTFEETKALAGKTIVYDEEENNGDDEQQAWEIVTEVHEGLDGRLRINNMPFSVWQRRHATIDGVPFGVTEVDTEAEKEAQK